jgi:hypothetical protein
MRKPTYQRWCGRPRSRLKSRRIREACEWLPQEPVPWTTTSKIAGKLFFDQRRRVTVLTVSHIDDRGTYEAEPTTRTRVRDEEL